MGETGVGDGSSYGLRLHSDTLVVSPMTDDRRLEEIRERREAYLEGLKKPYAYDQREIENVRVFLDASSNDVAYLLEQLERAKKEVDHLRGPRPKGDGWYWNHLLGAWEQPTGM